MRWEKEGGVKFIVRKGESIACNGRNWMKIRDRDVYNFGFEKWNNF